MPDASPSGIGCRLYLIKLPTLKNTLFFTTQPHIYDPNQGLDLAGRQASMPSNSQVEHQWVAVRGSTTENIPDFLSRRKGADVGPAARA